MGGKVESTPAVLKETPSEQIIILLFVDKKFFVYEKLAKGGLSVCSTEAPTLMAAWCDVCDLILENVKGIE